MLTLAFGCTPPAATSLHFTTNVTCEFLAQFCVSHHYIQTHLRFRLLYLVLALVRAFLNRVFMYVAVGDEMGMSVFLCVFHPPSLGLMVSSSQVWRGWFYHL